MFIVIPSMGKIVPADVLQDISIELSTHINSRVLFPQTSQEMFMVEETTVIVGNYLISLHQKPTVGRRKANSDEEAPLTPPVYDSLMHEIDKRTTVLQDSVAYKDAEEENSKLRNSKRIRVLTKNYIGFLLKKERADNIMAMSNEAASSNVTAAGGGGIPTIPHNPSMSPGVLLMQRAELEISEEDERSQENRINRIKDILEKPVIVDDPRQMLETDKGPEFKPFRDKLVEICMELNM